MTASEKAILTQFAEETCGVIRANIANKRDKRGRVSRASGDTEKAVRFELDEQKGELRILGPKHIFALEYGRKPSSNAGGGDMALWQRLRLWIDQKPLTVEAPTPRKNGKPRTHRDGSPITLEDKKTDLAKFLASRIHEKGTLRYQDNEPSGILSEVLNQEKISQLKERIRSRILEAVLNDLFHAVR